MSSVAELRLAIAQDFRTAAGGGYWSLKEFRKMEAIEAEDGRRRRRSYDEAFKRDAVRLISEEKYSFMAAATAVNVCEQSLRAWHAKFAPAPPPCGEHASVQELRDEVARLRKQLKRAELEREILKKATATY